MDFDTTGIICIITEQSCDIDSRGLREHSTYTEGGDEGVINIIILSFKSYKV